MTDWQPIETAPRDGTQVLAYERPNTYGMAWNEEVGTWKLYCGQPCLLLPDPTHWMPMPPPPE